MNYHIITAVDANYEAGLRLFIKNLEKQAVADYQLNIIILDNGLKPKQIQWAQDEVSAINKNYESCYTIEFKQIDLIKFKHLEGLYNQSLATYSKLFIPELVEYKDALYVDPDMIIALNVSAMIDYARATKAHYGMCIDQIGMTLAEECPWHDELALSEKVLPYYNAGLIYFNLEQARSDEFTRKGLELISDCNKPLKYYDQTVLNFLLRGRVTSLPESFNVTRNYNLYLSTWKGDTNIHFIGGFKPWGASNKLKYQESIRIYRDWMDLPQLPANKLDKFKIMIVRLKLAFAIKAKRRFKEMIKLSLPKSY